MNYKKQGDIVSNSFTFADRSSSTLLMLIQIAMSQG